MPGGHTLPPAWKRILARFLDGLIVGIAFGSIINAVVYSDGGAGLGGLGADASFGEVYTAGVLQAIVYFVWDAVMTKQYGGSPMKLAFGMKVVQADSGADVEWRHAIIRWAVPGAFALIPVLTLGGLASIVIVVTSLVFLFVRPLRQAVWDLAAGTLVVNR